MTRGRRMFWGAGAGVAAALPFGADLLEPLAWVALVPFLLLLSSGRVGRGLEAAASAGVAFVATGTFWLGRLSWAAVAIAALLFGGYLLALALVPWVRRRRPEWPMWIWVPWLWTFVASLPAAVTPYRTTWLSLGYTQAWTPALCQIAEWTGVHGVTWLVVLVNAAVADAWRAWRGPRDAAKPPARACLSGLALAMVLVGTAAAWGSWRRAGVSAGLVAGPRLRLVQANVAPADATVANARWWLGELIRLSATPDGGARPDLVVWPETAPLRPEHPADAEEARRIRAAVGAPLLLGATGLPRAAGDRRYANSAFLLGPDGAPRTRYDKQVLVPFGEYVPFVDGIVALRERVEAYVAREYGFMAFLKPGNESTLFRLEQTGRAGRAWRFGVLICYEDVLPELPARAAAGGADFLLVLSNENFYFAREMDQHLDMAVFRAIETRRPVLRATNTGLTAAIDPTGVVVATLDRDVDGALDVDVRLLASPPAPRGTLGAFPLACGVMLAAMLCVALLRAVPR